ncbi:MAG: hypothetical protein RRC07_09260 [Anaerolineae bacterium]|nr:hypothetical protein [Anaerolineae bacterium]
MLTKLLRLLLLIVVLLFLLVAASVVSNLSFPDSSESVDQLSSAEKARLAEAIHLRDLQGNAIWPGFGDVDIPIVVYNEAYAYLVNYEGEPPPGWVIPVSGEKQGTTWDRVSGDTFLDAPYYRQPLDGDVTPQAFTVRLEEQWAASLPTKEWSRISLAKTIRNDLPGWLRPIVPYSLVTQLLLGDSDKYISLLTHESFHAYIGIRAERHLINAEQVARQQEAAYPWEDTLCSSQWQDELDTLAAALRTSSRDESVRLSRQFLETRKVRRDSCRLATRLIDYEQQREWAEGLAKYVEMEAWRQGATAQRYTPHPATAALDDFHDYDGYQRAWNREVDQIGRMSGNGGDGRFYYSGMAQAVLLDALMPGWKTGALTGGTTLEGLLDAAVNGG